MNDINQMFYITFFTLLLINHQCTATNQFKSYSKITSSKRSAEAKSTRKITGGNDCSVERFPFFVSIRRLKSLNHFCGGTLIRPDWVITAAHCVAIYIGNPELFTVIAGRSTVNSLGVQRMRIKAILVHPEFNEHNYDNDIALIKLEHGFLITDVVKTIGIPKQVIKGDIMTVCPKATTIGWGWHDESNINHKENGSIPHVPVMQCILRLPVLSDDQCQTARGGVALLSNTFCAMVQTRQNICQGDSGGPLICNHMQFGVVSNGYTCNNAVGAPGYYIRIDKVLNFIKECLSGEMNYSRYRNYRGVLVNYASKLTCNNLCVYFCVMLCTISI